LTGSGAKSTIDFVFRGRVFTALIAAAISISVPGAALAGCMSGPTDAAMAQMACCKNSHDECHKSGDASDCCKSKSHGDQQNAADQQSPVKASSITKLTADVSAPALVRHQIPQASFVRSLPPVPLFAGTSSPPRLAFSVLLI
jgi:hypothetical protein